MDELNHQREEEAQAYRQQLAIAEIQLESLGGQLHRLPELEDNVSFLDSLNQELRAEIEKMREQLGRRPSAADDSLAAQMVRARDIDDAMRQLQQALDEKSRAEERYRQYIEKSREAKASYETQLQKLQARAEQAEADLKRFQEETKRFFNEQQTAWNTEREDLEAQLASALEGKRNWEDHLAANSASAKVSRARLALMSTSELNQELQRSEEALNLARQQAADAALELDEFKQKTAEMWELHQQTVQEEINSREALIEALKQRIDELEQLAAEMPADQSSTRRSENVSAVEEERTALLQQVQDLEAQLEQLRQKLQAAERQAAEARKQQQQLENTLAEQQAEAKALQTKLEQQQQRLQAAEQQHTEALAAVQAKLDRLQGESEEQSRQRAALAAGHTSQLQAQLDQLQAQIAQLQSQLRDQQAAAEQAGTDAKRLQARNAELEKQAADKTSALASAEKQHQSKVDDLARQLAEKQAALAEAEKKHADTLAALAEDQGRTKASADSELQRLVQELAAARQALAAAEKQAVSAQQEHTAALQQEKSRSIKLEGQAQAAEAQVRELERLLGMRQEQDKVAQERAAMAASNSQQLQTTVGQLQEDLKAVRAERERLQAESAASRQRLQDLERQLRGSDDERASMRARLAQLEGNETQLRELQHNLNRLNVERAAADERSSQSISDLQALLQVTQSRLHQTEAQLSMMAADKAALENELKYMQRLPRQQTAVYGGRVSQSDEGEDMVFSADSVLSAGEKSINNRLNNSDNLNNTRKPLDSPITPGTEAAPVGMVLDSRVAQLQTELAIALAERQKAAEDFEQRLTAMAQRLEEANNSRQQLARQLLGASATGEPLVNPDRWTTDRQRGPVVMVPPRQRGGIHTAGAQENYNVVQQQQQRARAATTSGSTGQGLLMVLEDRNRKLEEQLTKAAMEQQKQLDLYQDQVLQLERKLRQSEEHRQRMADEHQQQQQVQQQQHHVDYLRPSSTVPSRTSASRASARATPAPSVGGGALGSLRATMTADEALAAETASVVTDGGASTVSTVRSTATSVEPHRGRRASRQRNWPPVAEPLSRAPAPMHVGTSYGGTRAPLAAPPGQRWIPVRSVKTGGY